MKDRDSSRLLQLRTKAIRERTNAIYAIELLTSSDNAKRSGEETGERRVHEERSTM